MNITESAAIVSFVVKHCLVDATQSLLIRPAAYLASLALRDLLDVVQALVFISSLTALVATLKCLQRRYSLYHEFERDQVDDQHVTNLSGSDVRSVYKKLSWSYTQPDFESVDWLNQSAQTLWPSIKSILYKFILCDLVRKAQDRLKRKEIGVESIRLGDAIPIINGVQHVEDDDSLVVLNDSAHNNSFMIEMEYRTDKKFQILVDSLPLLGRVSLNRLRIQVRLLLTLNHTLNRRLRARDLDILDTPGDVRLPAINYAQVALVDFPTLDWSLERPSSPADSVKKTKSKGKSVKLTEKSFVRQHSDYLLRLINHSYFKYLVYTMASLGLRLFQPFDVKIGKILHINSIC